jgi:hypothetical protein
MKGGDLVLHAEHDFSFSFLDSIRYGTVRYDTIRYGTCRRGRSHKTKKEENICHANAMPMPMPMPLT